MPPWTLEAQEPTGKHAKSEGTRFSRGRLSHNEKSTGSRSLMPNLSRGVLREITVKGYIGEAATRAFSRLSEKQEFTHFAPKRFAADRPISTQNEQ